MITQGNATIKRFFGCRRIWFCRWAVYIAPLLNVLPLFEISPSVSSGPPNICSLIQSISPFFSFSFFCGEFLLICLRTSLLGLLQPYSSAFLVHTRSQQLTMTDSSNIAPPSEDKINLKVCKALICSSTPVVRMWQVARGYVVGYLVSLSNLRWCRRDMRFSNSYSYVYYGRSVMLKATSPSSRWDTTPPCKS